MEQKNLGVEIKPTKRRIKLATGSINVFSDNFGERYGLSSDDSLSIPKDFKSQVKLARNIYYYESIVGTVIDLMIDFCTTGMDNVCEDENAKKYFDNICKYSDFDQLHRWIFWEYFISGEVFILRGDKQVVKSGKDKGTVYFPYTVLNPLNVEIVDGLFYGKSNLAVKPNKEFIELFNNKKTRDAVIGSLPREMQKQLRKKKSLSESDLLILPENNVSRISRKRQPYQKYATPFLARIFEPVLMKRLMREADMATAEGNVNYITVVTEGNDQYPSTNARIAKLANLFASSPKKNKILFWNHTLKVEMHRSPVDIFGEEKYAQINKDILDGLGVSEILISGGQLNFATAWVGVMTLIERLQFVRNQVKRWQESEYRRIADELGLKFKTLPSVELHKINLKDEKIFLTLMMNLYDRGLLPIQTMQELAGQDPEVMEQLKRKEIESGLNKVFVPPYTPFSGLRPPQLETNKPGGSGRPTDDLESNYTKRSIPKPKGQATSLFEDDTTNEN